MSMGARLISCSKAHVDKLQHTLHIHIPVAQLPLQACKTEDSAKEPVQADMSRMGSLRGTPPGFTRRSIRLI